MKNLKHLLFAILLLGGGKVIAQVGINTDGSQPHPSAGLDVKFDNKGVLLPRMTLVQRDAISNPANGLIVICTNCGAAGLLNIYLNGSWKGFTFFSCFPSAPTAGTHVPSQTQIIWNWNPVSGATGYKWNTANNYASATDMGTTTTKTETGLTCNTSYTRYVWAYSGCGTPNLTTLNQTTNPCMECGLPITDARDGKTYNTMLIGLQCWLAQNLNVGTRINGSVNQTDNSTIEKYCYNDLESNCDVYGGLFQWDEYMNYTASSNSNPSGRQGICPLGWHIPSDAEWTQLTTYLGGESVAGGPMKEAGTSHWASPNTGATNASGFTALAGGSVSSGGSFNLLTNNGYFWSSAESSSANAWFRMLIYTDAQAYRASNSKIYGFSGRCCKD